MQHPTSPTQAHKAVDHSAKKGTYRPKTPGNPCFGASSIGESTFAVRHIEKWIDSKSEQLCPFGFSGAALFQNPAWGPFCGMYKPERQSAGRSFDCEGENKIKETKQEPNAYLATAPVGKLLLKFSIPCVRPCW